MTRGRDRFAKYENIINFISLLLNFLPKKIQEKIFIKSRNINGTTGLVLRYIFVKNLAKSCGKNVSIHPSVYIFNISTLSIGDNVSIHPMCYLECIGGLTIGNDVSIAHSSSFITSTHNYLNRDIPINNQGTSVGSIVISSDVWIGCKTTVLYNSKISHGAIVGANSLVNKNLDTEFAIFGGTPARKIGMR